MTLSDMARFSTLKKPPLSSRSITPPKTQPHEVQLASRRKSRCKQLPTRRQKKILVCRPRCASCIMYALTISPLDPYYMVSRDATSFDKNTKIRVRA